MPVDRKTELLEIERMLAAGDTGFLADYLSGLQPFTIAALLQDLDPPHQAKAYRTLGFPLAVRVFEFLNIEAQRNLLNTIDTAVMAQVLNDMSPDDRTALLAYLPATLVKELIGLLSEEERKVTLALLGYPKNSVGRLMTPNYLAIHDDRTVGQVLEHIRQYGRNSETLSMIYVIDERGRLIDDIRLREFLLAPPDTLVSQIMDHRYVALYVNQDQEEAVSIFRYNARLALPVIDQWGTLVGIVTVDDILLVAKEEDTEDIHKLGGIQALDEPYLSVPLLQMVRKRAGWLIVLFLGELLTATAMANFEDEIAKAVVLALFVPLIISSGGNSGSQATTLIIRAMALGEVRLRDWWRVMKREIVSGLLLGTILGIIGFARIMVWNSITEEYGLHWLLLGFTLGFTLLGVVLWGCVVGSMLPFLLRKVKLDPATASAPFVATLVDVTGLLLYFTIAYFFLKGTLL